MQNVHHTSSNNRQLKVAIPRLGRCDPDSPNQGDSKKPRAARACTTCRKRKVKCSGDFPRCVACEATDLDCIYDQSRRDRLRETTQQKQNLVSLLKELSLQVNDESKQRIKDVLGHADVEQASSLPSPSRESRGKRRKESQSGRWDLSGGVQVGEEAHVSGSVGSNEDLEFVGENLLRSPEARGTGFLGQNSEVHWLQSLQRQMDNSDGEPYGMPYGPPGSSHGAAEGRARARDERKRNLTRVPPPKTNDFSFYLDNESIDLDIMVDPFELPTAETAEKLFECYVKAVHSPFPILPKVFHQQIRQYYDAIKQNRPYQVPDKWKALLNLVFAIGARYSHLVDAQWRGDERDHIVYAARAVRVLQLRDFGIIMSAPDMPLIQATGLLAFYYLVTGRVSRAWIMIGISLRFAVAIGLHLRNKDPNSPSSRKEELVRTWWALRSIENIVGSIGGRPCVISNEDSTARLPRTQSDEQNMHDSRMPDGKGYRRSTTRHSSSTSTSSTNSHTLAADLDGSFLVAHIKICSITQKAQSSLYSARTAVQSWEQLQKSIGSLMAELDEWALKSRLYEAPPPVFNASDDADPFRERLVLRFQYNSTKMLITRPCLCRIERRLQGQSSTSARFNQTTAESCIQAAIDLASLLPDVPDPRYAYELGPWWSITHILMQAVAIFLLELCYAGAHISSHKPQIITCVKKLLRWLKSMTEDGVSQRAFHLVCQMLNKSKHFLKMDLSDVQNEASSQENMTQAYHEPPGMGESAHEDWQAGNGPLFDPVTTDFVPQYPEVQHDSTTDLEFDPFSLFSSGYTHPPTVYNNHFITPLDQDNPWTGTNAGNQGTDFLQGNMNHS